MATCKCGREVKWNWCSDEYEIDGDSCETIDHVMAADSTDDPSKFYLHHMFCKCGMWLGLQVYDGEKAIDIHIGAVINHPHFGDTDWEDDAHAAK